MAETPTIPKEWTGTLYTTMNLMGYNSGKVQVTQVDRSKHAVDDDAAILLGTHEVTLEIPSQDTDLKAVAVEILKDQQSTVQAKATKKINDIQHKIDSLLQIEYEVVE